MNYFILFYTTGRPGPKMWYPSSFHQHNSYFQTSPSLTVCCLYYMFMNLIPTLMTYFVFHCFTHSIQYINYIFSRFAFAQHLKNRTGEAITEAFKNMTIPHVLSGRQGKSAFEQHCPKIPETQKNNFLHRRRRRPEMCLSGKNKF